MGEWIVLPAHIAITCISGAQVVTSIQYSKNAVQFCTINNKSHPSAAVYVCYRSAVASFYSSSVWNTGSYRSMFLLYSGADKSSARPTSRCLLFDCENISIDASLVTYINSTNIPPIMIINRIYENQNLLLL